MQGVGKVNRVKIAAFLFFIFAAGLVIFTGARSSAQNDERQQLARAAAEKSKSPAKANVGGNSDEAAPKAFHSAAAGVAQEAAAPTRQRKVASPATTTLSRCM
jgi:hypothetical protein